MAARPLGGGARALLYRNFVFYRRSWPYFVSGFLEPVFYLFSIGISVGQLIEGFRFNGEVVPYAAFVAPGMLAASAMNGAVLDSTFGIFFKLRYDGGKKLPAPQVCAEVGLSLGAVLGE